jgi:hypothetical protein
MPHSRDSLVLLPGGRRALEPPSGEGLGEIEIAEFRRVVASCPADHFSAEDVGLLCSYVRARVLERRASEELLAAPAVAGTQNPWLPVYREAVRAVSTYTMRLRLGPKSRHPNNTRRMSKPTSPPSYYDLHPITETPSGPRGW